MRKIAIKINCDFFINFVLLYLYNYYGTRFVLAGHDYLNLNWDIPPFAENGIDKHIWSGPENKKIEIYKN